MPRLNDQQFNEVRPEDYEHSGPSLPYTGTHYRDIDPPKPKGTQRLADKFIYRKISHSMRRKHR